MKGTHVREIRGSQSDNGRQVGVSRHECEALFNYWRMAVMGNRQSTTELPLIVAGYFFEVVADGKDPAYNPIPLGAVRREILALLDRTRLSDNERTVIRMYYGLDGLPLPYASKSPADIAGGRHESSPRGTCKSGLAKVAGQVPHRRLPKVPSSQRIDPLRQPWFLSCVRREHWGDIVARAYVRAHSQCDGPHGPPTLAALEQWYDRSGYADPYLRPATPADMPASGQRRRPRPNGNARHRAAALMEIALYEEVGAMAEAARVRFAQLPVPNVGPPDSARVPETVTHPLLAAMLQNDLSPDELVAAAAVLQELALNGTDVSGRTSLFLRYLRPKVHSVSGQQLERLAVSISYLAAMQGNPFLALEWLGVFLGRVGITDRTFTVVVNTIEAAALGGYHNLADRTDRLFAQLAARWEIPDHQIRLVEHFEAEQQRLAGRAYRLERLAADQLSRGEHGRAMESLRRSIDVATHSARMAERVLADRSLFPHVDLDGKAGGHGGDLTWPWALAALACIAQPLDQLRRVAPSPSALDDKVIGAARFARSLLDDYEGPLDCNRFNTWHDQVDSVTSSILATAD